MDKKQNSYQKLNYWMEVEGETKLLNSFGRLQIKEV